MRGRDWLYAAVLAAAWTAAALAGVFAVLAAASAVTSRHGP